MGYMDIFPPSDASLDNWLVAWRLVLQCKISRQHGLRILEEQTNKYTRVKSQDSSVHTHGVTGASRSSVLRYIRMALLGHRVPLEQCSPWLTRLSRGFSGVSSPSSIWAYEVCWCTTQQTCKEIYWWVTCDMHNGKYEENTIVLMGHAKEHIQQQNYWQDTCKKHMVHSAHYEDIYLCLQYYPHLKPRYLIWYAWHGTCFEAIHGNAKKILNVNVCTCMHVCMNMVTHTCMNTYVHMSRNAWIQICICRCCAGKIDITLSAWDILTHRWCRH